MHAYDSIYLDDAMRNLGEAVDYAVNACKITPDEFMNLFIASRLAEQFGKGNPKYVAGMSGTELVMETVIVSGKKMTFPPAKVEYDCSPEYWCGWIIAYYQWATGRPFRDIHSRFSMQEILKLYPTLHEADEEKAVDTLNNMIKTSIQPAKLQQQRKRCGYTQKRLAEISGVNLRTLQQYELKAKEIDKASVQTVLALSNALGCGIEDIIEYSA